jgi:hypothetical protein
LLADYNPLAHIDAVNLEYVFGDIQTDRDRIGIVALAQLLKVRLRAEEADLECIDRRRLVRESALPPS